MKDNWTKYIGYILFIATVITWGFSAGKFLSRIESIEKELIELNEKIDKQQELLMKQQEFNGRVISYIEADMRNEED